MQQFIDSYDFTGKKAIVRVDFNVPLDENFNRRAAPSSSCPTSDVPRRWIRSSP